MLNAIRAVFSNDRGNDTNVNKAQQFSSFVSAASSTASMPIMMVDRDLLFAVGKTVAHDRAGFVPRLLRSEQS